MSTFKVGDVVRLEHFEGCVDDYRIGKEFTVKRYWGTHKGRECILAECYVHPITACTLVTPAPNPQPDTTFDRAKAEFDNAMTEWRKAVERAEAAEVKCAQLRKQRDLFWSQRDALQARIDAGVRVYFRVNPDGRPVNIGTNTFGADTHTAILIDPKPIAQDHIVDANKMVDDPRTGPEDRRLTPSSSQYGCLLHLTGRQPTRDYVNHDGTTVAAARSNTRRRTPGTVADRKPQWTRADGSTTPRTGERRKGLEIRCQCAECDFSPKGRKYKTCTTHHFKDNRRDPSGANDPRKGKA